MELPEAVSKMTSLPARPFQPGRTRSHCPEHARRYHGVRSRKLKEKTSYADPHQLAEGIEHVIVNGVLTLDRGCLTGHRGGEFL